MRDFEYRRARDAAAASALLREHPDLDIHAVVGDFERHLDRVPPATGRRLIAFLGSTIGNLDEPARHHLLAGVRRLLARDDRLLLCMDLVKDGAVRVPNMMLPTAPRMGTRQPKLMPNITANGNVAQTVLTGKT